LKRVLYVVVGLSLVAVVVLLGLRSADNPRFVLWFGLASAVLAPTAFFLFSIAWRSPDERLYSDLSRVPEIEKLIGEAKSQEERIALLEEQRARLNEIIQLEARRQTLVATREALEKDMDGLVAEYRAAGDELATIQAEVHDSPVLAEIERMQERIKLRKRGRVAVIKFGKRELVFAESELGHAPIDVLFFEYLRFIERLQRRKGDDIQPSES